MSSTQKLKKRLSACKAGCRRLVRNNAGFTLLEILLMVAITALVTGGGIAAYRRFEARQRVVNAGQEFVVVIRDVQKRAQSGELPASGCGLLDGWRVRRSGGNQFEIVSVCDGGVEVSPETRSLPSGIVFSGSSFDMTFNVLTGAVTGATQVDFVDSATGTQYAVEVSSAGGVSDLGVQN